MMLRRWGPVILWAAIILVSTSIPGPALPAGPTGSDKAGHFVMYAVLGALAIRAGLAEGRRPTPTLALTLAAIALFAAVDEWHQGFVPDRMPEVADWVADVAGATVGAASTALLTLRRSARS